MENEKVMGEVIKFEEAKRIIELAEKASNTKRSSKAEIYEEEDQHIFEEVLSENREFLKEHNYVDLIINYANKLKEAGPEGLLTIRKILVIFDVVFDEYINEKPLNTNAHYLETYNKYTKTKEKDYNFIYLWLCKTLKELSDSMKRDDIRMSQSIILLLAIIIPDLYEYTEKEQS